MTEPIRPLFVTATLAPGGAERHAVGLINRLSERGHECHAVHIKDWEPNEIGRVRLREGGTLRGLHAARFLDRRALRSLGAHLAQVRPSVLVAVNPFSLMYARLALALSGIRVPVALIYHSTQLPLKAQAQTLIYRPFFWTADRGIFVCERQRRHARWRALMCRSNEVIYNGVDIEAFSDRWTPEEHAARRRSFGFSETDYVIGISAWLRPEKNHVQLVAALASLRRRGIRARLLIIGEGEMRPLIEARARALGIEREVVITGSQKDVRPLVCTCDVMALCSTAVETFSLAALESMALGKPVVQADLGGAGDMIEPGREGFLFAVGDTAMLTGHLARLADRELARRMGRQARLTVETRFSERAMVDRYEQVLTEMSDEELTGRATVLGKL
jgi:glycosyltransferase involved in cell wall biosynthesis